MKKILLSIFIYGSILDAASGQQYNVPEGYFALDNKVTLVTGETWVSNNQTYRLYGVQSCIRGTSYTNSSGVKSDCGEASLAVFAAYIKDTKPLCAPVTKINETTYVSCYANISGNRLDLANILISQGYAFASIDLNGLPIHAPYSASEQVASQNKKGLWAFKDVQHPSILLAVEQSRRQKQKEQQKQQGQE